MSKDYKSIFSAFKHFLFIELLEEIEFFYTEFRKDDNVALACLKTVAGTSFFIILNCLTTIKLLISELFKK